MRLFFLLIFLLGSCVVCAQNYSGPKADIDQILGQAKAFSGFVIAGDLDGILSSYTEDGKIFPNNRPILEGKESLANYWRPQPGYRNLYHKLTPLEIKVYGDEARDHGYYEGRSVGPDGTERSWQGKYVVIWRKVAGVWKMYLDIWNGVPAKEAQQIVGLPAGFRVLARPGLWVSEGPQLGQENGLTVKSFRAGLGGKVVHVKTGTTDPKTGVFAPRNEGLRYWSAVDSSWHFQEYDRTGNLSVGAVSCHDRDVYYDYEYQGNQLRDAWIFEDNTHYRYVVGVWDGNQWVKKFHEGRFVFRPGGQ
ncbi:MAG: DUF4440 domain-containing protein [Bacteroidota bacterium]